MTLACEAVSTCTLDTWAVTDDARPDPACAFMMAAKTWPFWTSASRRANGVLGLKKASQSALICDEAGPGGACGGPPPPPGAELPGGPPPHAPPPPPPPPLLPPPP